MKRKLIKIGSSTLLLSMPREWVVANNLSKGDEIELATDTDKLTIWCNSKLKKEKLVLDISGFEAMLSRLIYAIYRSGIDQVEMRSDNPALIDKIKSVIWKEAVGYEIIDQGKNSCTVVNVSGKIEDFHNIMRRLFMVTLTMSNESVSSIKKKSGIQNILFLEEENNRLSTMLIRSLNKYGSFGFKKVGPVYYIIQELERIGDQYKFLSQFLMRNPKASFRPRVLGIFEDSSRILRLVYELFYSFQTKNVSEIRDLRDRTIDRIREGFEQKPNEAETMLLHHSLNITTRAFDMVNSIFIIRI